jgi:mRNA-degrading endonuclease RelE of RelBE toxin-antitoxin system
MCVPRIDEQLIGSKYIRKRLVAKWDFSTGILWRFRRVSAGYWRWWGVLRQKSSDRANKIKHHDVQVVRPSLKGEPGSQFLAGVINMIIFRPLQFKESKRFSEDVVRLLDDSEYAALQRSLVLDPEKGDVIRHTGGARKVRVGMRGRGKRGGGRVVYYYQAAAVIHFLLIYPKNEQEDLTPDEMDWVREAVERIKGGSL